ncbi:hypothetical protein [Aestuariibacter sp. A3R04]|uniref:hypothetical protein n=1 Tax=Aestuariibacter sp. A3R04 TaxID=2841571 RepID=UPI001C09CE0D|nr:hypothetical protein [Aestuariibacter sp. A3R04]MBU3021674.1 hypothetical protein [Aestuariibacter sp. A3R04]
MSAAQNDTLVVVANTDNQTLTLEKWQIRDLFMGNNGDITLEPIGLAPSNTLRTVFNTKIVGLTESRIQAYWAQMRFSGRDTPPTTFASQNEALQYVRQHKNTITYVSASATIPADLVIVYEQR